MRIVEVIPISRGVNKDALTYFSGNEITPGSIVRVPLRNKIVNALVIQSRPAEELKQEVRNATFTFKKIESIASEKIFSTAFMNAANKAAEYHVSTVGSLLASIVPRLVLENAVDLPPAKATFTPAPRLHGVILQTDEDDRFSHYRSLIREEFARGNSVFLCVPTNADIKKAEKLLEKGIGEYSHVFHTDLKKKELAEKWRAVTEEPHPILIIGTPNFLCVPREKIGSIIIERESSRSYKNISRPFTDFRIFAEMLSREMNSRLVFADSLLRTEIVWRHRNDELGEVSPPTQRIQSGAERRIIDMRKVQTVSRFEPLSTEIYNLIANSRDKNEQLLIFAGRRGLSPLTICADCGMVVTCHNCQSPVVLHSKSDSRFFLCHHCGARRDAHETCRGCGGWRLQALGVGIELVEEEIKEKFPDREIIRLDSDTVKTHAEASRLIRKFYDMPGGILLCTEMALNYLDQKITNVAVASVDSFFSLPDFKIREKIMSILVRLHSLAQKRFYVQTRNSSEPIFETATTGNLIDFYKQELADRESFDFPPFTVLIKISLTGHKEKVQNEMTSLKNDLADYDTSIYPAFSPWISGAYTMHALIKVPRSRWVDRKLFEKLKSLPPAFAVAVDPETIL